MMYLDRRYFLALGLGFLAPAPFAYAQTPREITWDDLIPPGVPYGEIIVRVRLTCSMTRGTRFLTKMREN